MDTIRRKMEATGERNLKDTGVRLKLRGKGAGGSF
jgi:hypothetical protein